MSVARRAEIKRRKSKLRFHFYLSGIIYVSVVVGMVLLLTYFVRALLLGTFLVSSSSMTPSLLVGDRILVNKIEYGINSPVGEDRLFERDPMRGDVVVFYRDRSKPSDTQQSWQSPQELVAFEDTHYVKRIVAIPGDIVEVRDAVTYVNYKPAPLGKVGFWEEQSEVKDRVPNIAPIQLGEGQYFVLGDNGSNSQDSRYFGPIDFEDIKGRVFIIIWSENRHQDPKGGLRKVVRWKRLGKIVH